MTSPAIPAAKATTMAKAADQAARAGTADPAMLEEAKSMLASAHGVIVNQNVRAGRDAYVAGRDMTINRPGE